MSDTPRFVQIAAAAAENGQSLFALDEQGRVWEYRWTDPNWYPGAPEWDGPGWELMPPQALRPRSVEAKP